jgi:trans-2,3-dihydro-3-hydroxyanthranilate isomerase
VDVFAEVKYGGNELAVVRNASSINDKEMQRIAREFNFSETTFILSDEEKSSGYDVRIFTPKEELPFAGHPTLGTAYVIQKYIVKKPVREIGVNLKIGQIPVTFTYAGEEPDLLWMKQIEPSFKEAAPSKSFFAEMLRIDEGFFDTFPIQEVSTGLPTLIVPLKDLNAVKKSQIDRAKYFDYINSYSGAKSILVFSRGTYSKEDDLNARVFVDYFGVPEDPATGSGNGSLAAYLVRNQYYGDRKIEGIRVEQGYEIGRPSLLYLTASEIGGKISVQVGGRVQSVLEGKLV